MKYLNLFFIVVLSNVSIAALGKEFGRHAITYKLENWRRLGDTIHTVCKAYYFSLTYKLPFVFKPFPYSDQFAIEAREKMLFDDVKKNYASIKVVDKISDLENALQEKEPLLFECHFLTEMPWIFKLSRENKALEDSIKTAFTPTIAIAELPKPEGVITVALHVRKGGGFDRPLASTQQYLIPQQLSSGIYLRKKNPNLSTDDVWELDLSNPLWCINAAYNLRFKKLNFSDYTWPLKFPCDQYYIEQLKTLALMLPGKNLLVYLFTDDPNPEDIMQRYSKALAAFPRIIFSYRTQKNRHDSNVLQDLFSIARCDCLISASSSFAFAAQLLGDHAIVITPFHATTFADKIIIDKALITIITNPHDQSQRKISHQQIGQILS